jgi:hypothetical protein
MPEPRSVEHNAVPTPLREPRTLDDVTSTAKGTYERDDLDVPAFLRKRGEVH